jgi:hypothetical protein
VATRRALVRQAGAHKPTQCRNKRLKVARYAFAMIESSLRWSCIALFSLLTVLPVTACKSQKSDDAAAADSAEPLASAEPGEHKHKHELPPAAFDACQGKGVGDACTVQFRDKQIEAKCAAAPDGRLACRPARGEHKKPDAP